MTSFLSAFLSKNSFLCNIRMAPKISEEVKKMLPENWERNFEPIAPEDIQVGDYIAYVDVPRAYTRKFQGENKGGFKKGGFITFVPDLEQSELRGNKDEVFGFRQYSFRWSVNASNVLLFLKTKENVEAMMEAAKDKSKKSNAKKRVEKVELENRILSEELKEAQEITKRARRRKTVPVDEEAPGPAPKRTRKRSATPLPLE